MKNLYYLLFLLIAGAGYGQTPQQAQKIIENYDISAIQSLTDSLQTAKQTAYNQAVQQAIINNWPLKFKDSTGSMNYLAELGDTGDPIYITLENADAAIATRTTSLHTNGSLNLNLNGENMVAFVWDGGTVLGAHNELNGKVTYGDTPISDPGSDNGDDHATHVTGTIIATGAQATAKGMAPLANAKVYDFNNNSDIPEATAATIGDIPMLVSNHSYSKGFSLFFMNDNRFGMYNGNARDWDMIMYNSFNYLMVCAAGNYALNANNSVPMFNDSNYDHLVGFENSKNNLVVANASEPSLDANGNFISAVMNSSSSHGPTDDLRIKPDITANGTTVYSSSSVSNSSYDPKTGTSMASPNVAGSLLLLQQYSFQLNNAPLKAATLKGLVLHTADDFLVEGPDAISGWGYLNTKKAAEVMRDNGAYSIIDESAITSGAQHNISVLSDGINPLIASVSWTDRQGVAHLESVSSHLNNTSPRLIADIDIRVTKAGTTYYPYTLVSPTQNTKADNIRDPFERVDIANASGIYTVTITRKNGFYQNVPQNYTIIISGIVLCSSVSPNLNLSTPVTTGEDIHKHASDYIIASNTVENGADAHYLAGDYVLMTTGFTAQNGSLFLADIGDCHSLFSPSFGRPGPTEGKQPVIAQTEIIEINKLLVYPNPASESVTIKAPAEISKLSLFTIDGKPIHIQAGVNSKEINLNISSYQNGMYLLSVETVRGETMYEKLIIE